MFSSILPVSVFWWLHAVFSSDGKKLLIESNSSGLILPAHHRTQTISLKEIISCEFDTYLDSTLMIIGMALVILALSLAVANLHTLLRLGCAILCGVLGVGYILSGPSAELTIITKNEVITFSVPFYARKRAKKIVEWICSRTQSCR